MRRALMVAAYLWSTMLLAGCGWKGEPKVPIDPAYAACKQTCKAVCTADGKCLPTEAK